MRPETNKLLAIALSLAACQSSQLTTHIGEATPAIINGTYDTGDPAIVQVNLSDALCSGTLISSKIILTAAHCVTGENGPGATNVPVNVFVGSDSSKAGVKLPVINAAYNPMYGGQPTSWSNDSAIAVLATRYTDTTPIPYSSQPLDETFDGTRVRIIGFGEQSDPNGKIGQKMQTTVSVLGIDQCQDCTDHDIMTGTGICSGDSGGPMLYDFGDGVERVIGITSFGLIGCNIQGQENWSQRTDLVADWIASQVALYDPPSCDKDFRCQSGCPSADPDCPCDAHDGFCSALCGDPDSDPDCPANCGADGTCVKGSQCPNPDPDCGDPCQQEGHCITTGCATRDPDCAPPQDLGQSCIQDADCDNTNGAVCLADKTGATTCQQSCQSNSDCPDGTCDPLSASISICHPKPKTGGCDVGGSSPSRAPAYVSLLALLGIALAVRRRGSMKP